ncbi:hypothetical protein SAMN04488057_102301 [Cyclobacterium lianum]|uniref:Uncharacterized protein n=1 Tax=Cyclobacterium lianum TaxID=388280 RepID=A0A1M7K5A5_9BACT|nr:hypothetical protein [Cyclobacterium lianum]SHM60436.1 hypothetical protein SAMN04488057_102301 [Cyclobacterium lianum]
MSVALLVLIHLMLLNNMVFYHEHDLETGETIRHAHPFFSEEEEQKREHSENELILLDMLTHAQFFLPDDWGFNARKNIVYEVSRPPVLLESPGLQIREILSLRGPPIFSGFPVFR